MLGFAKSSTERKAKGPVSYVRNGRTFLAVNVQNTKFKILAIAIWVFFGVMGFPEIIDAGTTNQISQYGFSYYFDKQYTYGQFINGDYWVVGPVTITSITPSFDGANYGWEVNPTVSGTTGLQNGCTGSPSIDTSKIPALPYTANAGQSILKASPSGRADGRPCLQTAAVLTVVSSPPPGNGADVFRPPYVGTIKPYYYYADVRTELLPSLAPVGTPPTLAWVENRFKRVQLNHASSETSALLRRALCPIDNLPDYGGYAGKDNVTGILRLMLNDSLAAKKMALVHYLQMGIDLYHIQVAGQKWLKGGGHTPGILAPLAFFAVMLGDSTIKDYVTNIPDLNISEKRWIKKSTMNPEEGLFGDDYISELQYWTRACSSNTDNQLEWADRYGFIDGGANLGISINGYQEINTPVWKGQVLAAYLIPEMISLYNSAELFGYIDRFVTSGLRMMPDPCAPCGSTYGVTHGPDPQNPGMCIRDPRLSYYYSPTNFGYPAGVWGGRFPSRHGTKIDSYNSAYSTPWQREMWNKYRPLVQPFKGGIIGFQIEPPTGVKIIH